MKKIILGIVVLGLLSTTVYSKKIEQTICFSIKYSGKRTQYFPKGVPIAELGDSIKLYGGKCRGRSLPEMNKNGWKLIQVVTGLNSSFGMVLTKEN